MTIKPLATQKRSSAAADVDKKDSHGAVVGQVVGVGGVGGSGVVGVEHPGSGGEREGVVVRGGVAASHSHGQSPQRRGEVFDELTRTHRRSPHKSTRSKRRDDAHHHTNTNKRDRGDKHSAVLSSVAGVVGTNKCSSPHALSAVANASSGGGNSPANTSMGMGGGGNSPEHLTLAGCQTPMTQPSASSAVAVTTPRQAAANLLKAVEKTCSGYNSGDEHLPPTPKEGAGAITADEWQRRDEQFAKCMTERGYVLKPVEEDGACLFRAISLQIYGDEEMHDVIRQHTMDYIYKNREYFGHFVTEDINSYIKRKRRKDSHGNHIEIQAMSEIYSRPVEVYCYKPTPINIFNSEQLNNGYVPLRLSYQRGSHYNAIIDPYNATVGVGLGLAGYRPELQTKEAMRMSEQLEIEQTMFEDKLKTTDWEATNEAIEEQIARESYLQWCRENLQKSRAAVAATCTTASSSATVTSAGAGGGAGGNSASDAEASPSKYSSVQRCISSTTVTAATLAVSGAVAASSSSCCSSSSSFSSNRSTVSPATGHMTLALSTLAHVVSKKDGNELSAGAGCGFDSDDTDMSSTSSIGSACAALAGGRARASKKKKTRIRSAAGSVAAVIALRGSKKRRREQPLAKSVASGKSLLDTSDAASARKSPKHESPTNAASGAATHASRARTPTDEAEQQPCTSKQSTHTPEKRLVGSSEEHSMIVQRLASPKKPLSNFYQELLEASYATNGQLTESEMLQQAIRMSQHDYIEDQKRKYLYGP